MTQYRSTFGQETAADAKKIADAKQEAEEKKVADAKEKKDADAKAAAKDAKAEAKAEEKEEKKEAKPARHSLPKQLEDVIEKLEKHDTPFDQEDQLAFQGLGKRLSRTLGAYRAPKEE